MRPTPCVSITVPTRCVFHPTVCVGAPSSLSLGYGNAECHVWNYWSVLLNTVFHTILCSEVIVRQPVDEYPAWRATLVVGPIHHLFGLFHLKEEEETGKWAFSGTFMIAREQ